MCTATFANHCIHQLSTSNWIIAEPHAKLIRKAGFGSIGSICEKVGRGEIPGSVCCRLRGSRIVVSSLFHDSASPSGIHRTPPYRSRVCHEHRDNLAVTYAWAPGVLSGESSLSSVPRVPLTTPCVQRVQYSRGLFSG